jgi:hypothetical protein
VASFRNGVLWIINNTGIDEMLLEAARAFIATSIAVALGLGIPLLDISDGDFRTVISAGLAACLQVIVRALNPEDGKFGVGAAKKAKAKEEADASTDGPPAGGDLGLDDPEHPENQLPESTVVEGGDIFAQEVMAEKQD